MIILLAANASNALRASRVHPQFRFQSTKNMSDPNPYRPPDQNEGVSPDPSGRSPGFLAWTGALLAGGVAFVFIFGFTCVGTTLFSIAILEFIPSQLPFGIRDFFGNVMVWGIILGSFGLALFVAWKVAKSILSPRKR